MCVQISVASIALGSTSSDLRPGRGAGYPLIHIGGVACAISRRNAAHSAFVVCRPPPYKKTTHSPWSGRKSPQAESQSPAYAHEGREVQASIAQQAKRHSAEEAGSDSSMSHRGREWGRHTAVLLTVNCIWRTAVRFSSARRCPRPWLRGQWA